VAVDDAVGIQHGNDFKYEMVAQLSRNVVIGHQKLEDAFDNEACITFSWVNPTRDEEDRTALNLRRRTGIANCQNLAAHPSFGLAQLAAR